MNKKLYSILFFVPLIVSLLAMTVVTGCSDDDEPLQSTYGYVQFKLLKSASMDKGTTTRAVTDKLDKLSDAQKVKVVMQYNGSTITQTLLLDSYNAENAEFGLRSDKLKEPILSLVIICMISWIMYYMPALPERIMYLRLLLTVCILKS